MITKSLSARILVVLESLDEPDAHGKASNGQCAQFLWWESFDSSRGARDEPDCDCELGAVILALSDEEYRRCVRW